MLRFAHITLVNPAKPDLKAINVRAIVTDEECDLMIGPTIADQLQLTQVAKRAVAEVERSGTRLLPYVGPLRVICNKREAFTGAIRNNMPGSVVIGGRLARELRMNLSGPESASLPLLQTPVDRLSLEGIMIREQLIDEETCGQLCEYAVTHDKRQSAMVVGRKSYVDKSVRDVKAVMNVGGIKETLQQATYEIFATHIEPFFGVEIECWETPQLLSYVKGGKYEKHADADRWIKRPGNMGGWQRNMDRDISLIVYLNEEFTGGLLDFPDHNMKVQPKRGLAVAFPSTGPYSHGAEPTISGERIVMVTWSLVKGSPRLYGSDARKNYIHMDAMRQKQTKGSTI